METVQFHYTQSVWSPAEKAGRPGDERELPADVAAELETEGYGYIRKEATDASRESGSGKKPDGGRDYHRNHEGKAPGVPD